MKRKLVQALITTFVMSALIVTPVFAVPDGDVQSLEVQKNEAEAQANGVNAQLVELLVRFDVLQKDIENQKEKISKAESDLQKAQEEEQRQYEEMKLRIKYMYEEGNTTFLETLVSAKSYSDLVNKADYVKNVHSYDRKMLKEYMDTKEQVAALKTELEAGEADMESMSASLSQQQASLEGTLADMRSQIADFDNQLEQAKNQAAAQVDQLTEATENMVIVAESGGKSNGGSSNSQTQNNTPAQNNGGGNKKPENNSSGNSGGNNSGSSGGSSNNSGGGGNSSNGSSNPGNASLGQQIANKASSYIGNPYVYGGTSLTNGADCSGFVQSVHKLFGISTPRTSWAQLDGGKAVAYSAMLPGDVIVYGDHVAIYIGGNTVVHASNSKPYPAGGIKTTKPANYRTVLGVRRYW